MLEYGFNSLDDLIDSFFGSVAFVPQNLPKELSDYAEGVDLIRQARNTKVGSTIEATRVLYEKGRFSRKQKNKPVTETREVTSEDIIQLYKSAQEKLASLREHRLTRERDDLDVKNVSPGVESTYAIRANMLYLLANVAIADLNGDPQGTIKAIDGLTTYLTKSMYSINGVYLGDPVVAQFQAQKAKITAEGMGDTALALEIIAGIGSSLPKSQRDYLNAQLSGGGITLDLMASLKEAYIQNPRSKDVVQRLLDLYNNDEVRSKVVDASNALYRTAAGVKGEALKKYDIGNAMMRRGNYTGAVTNFEEALGGLKDENLSEENKILKALVLSDLAMAELNSRGTLVDVMKHAFDSDTIMPTMQNQELIIKLLNAQLERLYTQPQQQYNPVGNVGVPGLIPGLRYHALIGGSSEGTGK